MQNSMPFSFDIYDSLFLENLESLPLRLDPGDKIFFIGDLGSGKTTLVRHLLRNHLADPDIIVRSPTYTYYQKYGANIYHFDLYRVESFEDLLLIGALDILENPDTICLIEWPEILGERIHPTKKVSIEPSGEGRKYSIEKSSP